MLMLLKQMFELKTKPAAALEVVVQQQHKGGDCRFCRFIFYITSMSTPSSRSARQRGVQRNAVRMIQLLLTSYPYSIAQSSDWFNRLHGYKLD